MGDFSGVTAFVAIMIFTLLAYTGRELRHILQLQERSLERLHGLLDIRLPDISQRKLDRLQRLASAQVIREQLLKGGNFGRTGAQPHPMVKLADDCAASAYESAQEVLLTSGPVEEMQPEEREEFLDVFWHRFRDQLRGALYGAGARLASDGEQYSEPRETGSIPTQSVGDVIIRRIPGIGDEGFAQPYKVLSVSKSGPLDRGHFWTEGGAYRRGLRLAGKDGTITIDYGDGTWSREKVK